MNTTLTPGVRELPSILDLQILNAIRQGSSAITLSGRSAPLRGQALIAITNGSFDLPADLGWDSRGNAQILNRQAVLREHSSLFSNFSQTFLVPDGVRWRSSTR